jgi:hypothetical protein
LEDRITQPDFVPFPLSQLKPLPGNVIPATLWF